MRSCGAPLLALVALAVAGCAHGGRATWREIVWEGLVVVREDVTVGAGERLVIRPGTRVVFAFRDDDGDGSGDARIVIGGEVRAVGTQAAPIVFVPEREGALPGWEEILVEDAAGARFSWCTFGGARQALHVHRTPLLVENCRFERNGFGVRFTGGAVAIRASRFVANGTAVRYWESSPRIAGNEFEGNDTAIFVRESSAQSVVTGNNFSSSADYHIKLGEEQPADVDAGGNWWGTADREQIERLIFDREDAGYLGRVRYHPPAAGPVQTGAP